MKSSAAMAAKKPGGTELSDFVEVVLEVDGERSLFRFYVVDYTWTRQGARMVGVVGIA